MTKANTAASRLTWLWSGLTGLLIFVAAGCEPYDLMPEDEEPGMETAATPQEPVAAEPVAAEPVAEPEKPEVKAPPVASGVFRWEPRADSIRVVIPAHLAHWQFHLFTRIQHHTLFGPDNRASNLDVTVEYILPGGPAEWAARARSLDSRAGAELLVYVNTRDTQATGSASAGWRIMDPFSTYVGDGGTRLQPGENR